MLMYYGCGSKLPTTHTTVTFITQHTTKSFKLLNTNKIPNRKRAEKKV